MRPVRRAAMLTGIAALFYIAEACAETVTLTEALTLRAGPGLRYRQLATAPAGATLSPEPGGTDWTRVDYNGRSYYADTRQFMAAAGAAETLPIPQADPTCDYSYPYSGSNLFFDRPLAKLRHSEPLGFLFGYHRRNPC